LHQRSAAATWLCTSQVRVRGVLPCRHHALSNCSFLVRRLASEQASTGITAPAYSGTFLFQLVWLLLIFGDLKGEYLVCGGGLQPLATTVPRPLLTYTKPSLR
jgi:hypothetical protein